VGVNSPSQSDPFVNEKFTLAKAKAKNKIAEFHQSKPSSKFSTLLTSAQEEATLETKYLQTSNPTQQHTDVAALD